MLLNNQPEINIFYVTIIDFNFFDVSVLIQFNFSLKKEIVMEASRDRPFQLISVKIIFDIQAESYSCSSREF